MRFEHLRSLTGAVIASLAIGCGEAPRLESPDERAALAAAARERLLLASTKIALPPPGVAAAELPDPNSQGAQLLATYCAQCHALPVPSMHSATDWPGVIRRMWLRMDWLPADMGIAVPSPEERVVLLDYLNQHALQVSGATLPSARGRETFSIVCSRCHALPDPRLHTAADWPTVFQRMGRNMERMEVAPPSNQQAAEILTYLQSVTSAR